MDHGTIKMKKGVHFGMLFRSNFYRGPGWSLFPSDMLPIAQLMGKSHVSFNRRVEIFRAIEAK
jgi:hypothetical protein